MLASCNWFKDVPVVGTVLSDHFKNKLYKKFDTAVYNVVFKKHFDSLSPKFSNPNTLKNYYYSNEFKPELVTKFFVNGGLDSLKDYIDRSEEHGFSPSLFRNKQIELLLVTLRANKFKSIDEVYPIIADLELNAAEGLIKYNNF